MEAHSTFEEKTLILKGTEEEISRLAQALSPRYVTSRGQFSLELDIERLHRFQTADELKDSRQTTNPRKK